MTRQPAHGKARPEAATSASLLLQLSPTLAGHLATAVRAHRQWAARVSLPAPPELAELERIFTETANGRQQPSVLDELAALRDRPPVAARLLDYRSVADGLSVSVRTVERLVAAGQLRTVRVGGASRVPVADLDAYIENLKGAA